LEDVDAFHKEVGDKCFHEDLTRGEKLSYKKSHPRVAFKCNISLRTTSQIP
jgi:translation elongation factor EF-4